MKSTKLLIALLLMTTSLAGCLNGDSSIDTEGTDALNEDIQAKNDQIDDLETNNTELNAQILLMQVEQTNLMSEISILGVQLSDAEDNSSALSLLHTEALDNITALEDEIAELDSENEALNASLVENVSIAQALADQLNNANAQIIQLQSEMVAINSTIAAYQAIISSLEVGWGQTNASMASPIAFVSANISAYIDDCPEANPPMVIDSGYDDGLGGGTAGDGILEDAEIRTTTTSGCQGHYGVVKHIGVPSELTALGSTLYFSSSDTNGRELWKSDGTLGGTVMVKDICSGTCSSNPNDLIVMGNTLFFAADNGAAGEELWKTDGTETGTVMVADIYSGQGGSWYGEPTVVGSTLFFKASDGTNGVELWKSDGTTSGTTMVRDINPNNGVVKIYQLTAVGNTLYFSSDDDINGYELWKSNGTEAGTEMVMDICAGSCGGSPGSIAVIGSTLYFRANDGVNGRELWKSDGTVAGTEMVVNIGGSESLPGYHSGITAVGTRLYFDANGGTGDGVELWAHDTATDSTWQVYDINSGGDSDPGMYTGFTAVGTKIYFGANDGNGHELWVHDTSNGATWSVSGLLLTGNNPYPGLVGVGSTLYVAASGAGGDGYELWKTDGTVAGTVLVEDINTGSIIEDWMGNLESSSSSYPHNFVVIGDKLFFSAAGPGILVNNELWWLDLNA